MNRDENGVSPSPRRERVGLATTKVVSDDLLLLVRASAMELSTVRVVWRDSESCIAMVKTCGEKERPVFSYFDRVVASTVETSDEVCVGPVTFVEL